MNLILKDEQGMLVVEATETPVGAEVTLPTDLSEFSVKRTDKLSIISSIMFDFRFRFKRNHGCTMVPLEALKYQEVNLCWHFATKEKVVWMSLAKRTEPEEVVPPYRKSIRY